MISSEPQLDASPPRRDDEAALLARAATGDRDAFRKLYGLYHRRLHRFLSRLTNERELTEEIINDTMMIVWQQAGQFRGDSLASTWILGIAYRRALKALERRRSLGQQTAMLAAAAIADHTMLDRLSQSAELGDWVDVALTTLSAEHRMVIELAYFLGLSCEEISKVADCPVGTVKTRMFYARERLREALLSHGNPGNGTQHRETPLCAP
jgi:RNA polymerase sigma-70 factor (ECF subfamily)